MNEIEEILKTAIKKMAVFYIRLKIIPNAQKTAFKEVLKLPQGITYKLAVNAQPKKGKANKEILQFLEKTLDCNAKIINGHTNVIKLIQLT